MLFQLHRIISVGDENTSHRDYELDALRSFAMLYIIGFWHLFNYSESLQFLVKPLIFRLLKCCMLGLFSYISGLLLSRKYALGNWQEVIRFYRRRFFRIYPLFLASLAGFLLVGWIDVRTFFVSVVSLNMFLPALLPTLWFVTMILLFYAITPLFLLHYTHTKTILLTFLFMTGFVILHWATGLIDLRLPQYLVPFALGILIGRSPALSKALRYRQICIISVIVFLMAQQLSFIGNDIIQMLVVDAAILGAIPLFLLLGRWLVLLIPTRALLFLSISSFVAYLIHRNIFGISLRIYNPDSMISSFIYLVLIVLPLTLMISYFIQKVYDWLLQINSLKRRYRQFS